MGDEWGSEEGADECDGDELEDSFQAQRHLEGLKLGDEQADAGDGDEGELEAYMLQIERIDTQHDEEGEGTGIDGQGCAREGLAKQENGEHECGTDE